MNTQMLIGGGFHHTKLCSSQILYASCKQRKKKRD